MRRSSWQRTTVAGRLRVGWRTHRGNRHGGRGAPMRRSSWQRTTVVGRRHAAGVGRHSDLSARPPAPFSTPTLWRRNFCGRRQQKRHLHRRSRNTTEITRWKAAKVEGIPLSSWSVFRRQDGACLQPKPRIGVTGVTGGGSSGALGRGACTEKVRTQHGRLQGFVRSGRETTPARYSRCRASLRV